MFLKFSSTKFHLFLITIFGFLITINPAYAQVKFTDVTEAAGLGDAPAITADWATWGDYDNDGDGDVVLLSPRRRLYRNEGNGRFLDVTETVGITDASLAANVAIFLDFDNDGNLDLFLGGGGAIGDALYRNKGDGTFINISQAAGMESKGRSYWGAISFDYDNDGLLDIYVANFNLTTLFPNFLYRNEGKGRFKEIAAQIGLDKPDFAIGPALGDYDNDGDLDLFLTVPGPVGIIQGINVLYRNEGGGKFIEVAQQAGVQKKANQANSFFWDYDNDGDLDLFVQSRYHGDVDKGNNSLYRNNGNGSFTDVTQQAGIIPVDRHCDGSNYGDYDNDGWLDLCMTYEALPTALYHNNGNGTFTDVSKDVGISGTNTGTTSFVDYDNDGDLDIFTGGFGGGNIALYRNNGTENSWLRLKLVGTKSNRDAIGARVKVKAGNLSMLREIAGSSGAGSHQDRLPAHFGLGKNRQADIIEIRWPSGTVDVLRNIPANRLIEVKEGLGIQAVSVESRGKLPIMLGHIKQTALLQNYPNPFNPETWIPFVLQEEAKVEIRIYEVSGNQVRTLNLGQKASGEYLSKEEAAYWDGKNDVGEAVSSGVYFYELRACRGDACIALTSVRKAMLLK